MSTAAAVALPVVTVPSDAEIEARFMDDWPEVQSRCRAIARATPGDREENEAEAMAFCWRNFRQAALQGRWLPPGLNAALAWRWIRSGRSVGGGTSITDAMDPRAGWMGRARIISMTPYLRSRRPARQQGVEAPDETLMTRALSSNENDTPLERARIRLDWQAFADGQDARTRTILAGLTEGYQHREIAERLEITNGRLSQIIAEKVGPEVAEFFGLDAVGNELV